MAKKNEVLKVKKDQQQKVLVTKGGKIGGDEPLTAVYTERVPSVEVAKTRVEELKKEYADHSVYYFSV